jgi:hypothetical protein
MLQFPAPVPLGDGLSPTNFEQFCGSVVLYLFLLTPISYLLPRAWFVALFKIVLPLMPERIGEDHAKG